MSDIYYLLRTEDEDSAWTGTGGLFQRGADEIERLREALSAVKEFLTHEQWGTVSYMEGSDIYDDLRAAVQIINEALVIRT